MNNKRPKLLDMCMNVSININKMYSSMQFGINENNFTLEPSEI